MKLTLLFALEKRRKTKMKFQWNLIIALLFALIIAIFAVVNVDPVLVDYVFGQTELPLIIIILGSALLGGLIVGSFGLFRSFVLQRQLKNMTKEKGKLEETIKDLTSKKDSPPNIDDSPTETEKSNANA